MEIISDVTDTGQITTSKKYLNLSERAIADSAAAGDSILNKTGSKLAYKYNYKTVENEDGSTSQVIDTGSPVFDESGNQVTATPLEWMMVPDANAPGGYRITKVDFNDISKTAGQDFVEGQYRTDDGKTFLYNLDPSNDLFANLENVNASDFITDESGNKLTLAQWAETEGGKAAIAANDYRAKNKNMQDTNSDGMLDPQGNLFDHTASDSNLGLGIGAKINLDLGDGYQLTFAGPEKPTNWVPPIKKEEQGMGGYGSGGPTYINLDMNQKSTTAADQAGKQDEKGMASGANRKKYQNPVKTSGNVPQLGITTNKRQSLIPAG